MTTLYRKYRPQFFRDVVGQEPAVKTLNNELAIDRLGHAYLFSGPRGTGKTTLARLLAKAINCTTRVPKESEPCGTCDSCQEITGLKSIDVIEIDAASQTGVDNVRENIIENARFKPTKSKYKIFIIDEVHMLSTSSFNALLKTLEEPPEHVVFILATTELHKLPATIVSRCQRFHFERLAENLVINRLQGIAAAENLEVDETILRRIAARSDGCLRDAESLLGQMASAPGGKITAATAELFLPAAQAEIIIEHLQKTSAGDISGALQMLSAAAERGTAVEFIFEELITILRLCLILKNIPHYEDKKWEYGPEHWEKIVAIANNMETNRLIRLLDRALERRQQIKTSPLPYLGLELWTIENGPTVADEKNTAPPPASEKKSFPASTPSTPPTANEKREKLPLKNPETNTPPTSPVSSWAKHSTAINTSIDAIKKRWDEIIAELDASSRSLTFILKMSTLDKLDEAGLQVSVPYVFHKERLEENKNKKLIENTLYKFFAEKIPLRCIAEPARVEAKYEDQSLRSLATEFGGEIVN